MTFCELISRTFLLVELHCYLGKCETALGRTWWRVRAALRQTNPNPNPKRKISQWYQSPQEEWAKTKICYNSCYVGQTSALWQDCGLLEDEMRSHEWEARMDSSQLFHSVTLHAVCEGRNGKRMVGIALSQALNVKTERKSVCCSCFVCVCVCITLKPLLWLMGFLNSLFFSFTPHSFFCSPSVWFLLSS